MATPLFEATVADILGASNPADLVVVRPDELVPAVLEKMAARHILSVPVYADTTGPACNSFFDLHDLLACTLEKDVAQMTVLTVGEARNKSKFDVFWPVTRATGVLDLAELFCRGVHRVPVVEGGVLVGIVSQSTLMAFLAEHVTSAGAARTLESLGCVTHSVLSVAPSVMAAEAFRTLNKHAIDALPIVDSHGGVLGTLSVSSLRGTSNMATLAHKLALWVGDFVKQQPRELNKTVGCNPDITLAEAVVVISENRCHRLLMLDPHDGGRLVGMVTLTDVLRALIKDISGVSPSLDDSFVVK